MRQPPKSPAAVLTALFAALLPASAAFAGDGRLEAFAGYYVAEETDDEISFGARGGWDSGRGWGLLASVEQFDTSGAGYGERAGVDTEIRHFELSYVAYPRGAGLEIFSGLGLTDLDVRADVVGAELGFAGTELSIHAGIGYRAALGDNLYLRPELRVRGYDAGDETLDVTASIAIGFRWEGDQ